MRRNNRKVRLFRALSDQPQKAFGLKTGVHPTLIARYELDDVEPSAEHLELLAAGAGLTVAAGDQILDFADALRPARQRAGQGAESLYAGLASLVNRVYQRLLRLPPPGGAAGRQQADDLWDRLKDLPPEHQLAVVQVARKFQTHALAERVRVESEHEASRDPQRAATLARLAQEIAAQAGGVG
jgi:transcriptional regulator with XRE-family HTH domain